MTLPPWLVRWLVVAAVIVAAAITGFFKGVDYCENQEAGKELDSWHQSDKILAKNKTDQAKLQENLDAALDLLSKTKDTCLSTPHPVDVVRVLNLGQ